MIIKKLILVILSIFILGCSQKETEADLLHKKDADGLYGSKITLADFQTIDDLLASPKQFIGQNVKITGEIIEVCPMRGCWISVKNNSSDKNIRVKVTDGQIVFPLSAKGKQVDVQGEFAQLEFSEEQARKWKVHLEREKGININPEDVQISESDLVEYRIVGKGAEIYTFGCNPAQK